MNVFPVELHSYICEFACKDDGRTARSIGLVSKYFREVVHPYTLRSIAVTGFAQIKILEKQLTTLPAHLRRIRDLFISDHDGGPESKNAIIRILGLSSPSLETLSIHTSNPRTSTPILAFLFGLHYPHLCELSVTGYYPFPSLPGGMPRLTHLHLNGNRSPHGLLQMGVLESVCPELTHLRISGLSRATAFASELTEALAEPSSPSQTLFNARLPPNVRSIVIQPAASMPGFGKGPAQRLTDDLMIATIEGLVRREGDLWVTVLKRSDGDGDMKKEAKREWMDRLSGNEGCWVGHERSMHNL